MKRLMGLLALTVACGLASGSTILYENDFRKGTGQSLSVDGWTGATSVFYAGSPGTGTAQYNETTPLMAEYALSHSFSDGETVVLQGDILGFIAGAEFTSIGIKADSGTYANGRVSAYSFVRACADGAAVAELAEYDRYTVMTFRIALSQTGVLYEMKHPSDADWISATFTPATPTTAITGIFLAVDPSWTGNGLDAQWQNLTVTSSVPEPATIGLLVLGGLMLRKKNFGF